MPSLSEFITFISRRSGVKNLELIEKDVILHLILREIYSSAIGQNYLFKGGSCLVKCYFGYYRFSVDLDFTWKNQAVWEGLGKRKLRRTLLKRITDFAGVLEKACSQAGLNFKPNLKDKRLFEFGGGGRMITYKLWKGLELVKIQVNFVEKILFKPKKVFVKTLLNIDELKKDEKVYFDEFLEFYNPFQVTAYDERDILCEKVRAILTRRAQKLRDFYDLFILQKHGFKIEDFKSEILKKIEASLYYKKYRDALEKNKEKLEIGKKILENPFERSLFIKKPENQFEHFLNDSPRELREIASICTKYR